MTDHVAAGARSLNRPPLRTYSKRSAPNSTEPPAKKRRVESSNVDIHSIAGRFAQKLEAACQSKHDPQSQVPVPTPAQQPKKGTILSYFKVRSPSSTTSSSCAQVSEVMPLSSTPPSSIPSESNDSSHKKRRRLTTKPPLRNSDTSSPESDDDDSSDTKQQTQVTKDAMSTVQDLNGNLIDQDSRAKTERPDARERGTKKGSKFKKATVQTTLSLSLTEKQFIECNECNMLYNPYHEKDLKMHKKRHAAVMKANKAKGKDEACSH